MLFRSDPGALQTSLSERGRLKHKLSTVPSLLREREKERETERKTERQTEWPVAWSQSSSVLPAALVSKEGDVEPPAPPGGG